jgi:hypothetical protein
MDRALERAFLGVGRSIRQGQGASQRQGQERRGILVRGSDANCSHRCLVYCNVVERRVC